MEHIAAAELDWHDDDEHHDPEHKISSSFLPKEFPGNLLPSSAGYRMEWPGYDDDKPCEPCPRARRYLPCHYFDLFCGTSTGA
jgi:hypothetical protein